MINKNRIHTDKRFQYFQSLLAFGAKHAAALVTAAFLSGCAGELLEDSDRIIDYYLIQQPNAQTHWRAGAGGNAISWETVYKPAFVNIELLKEGSPVQTLATAAPNNGLFTDFTVDAVLPAGENYQVQITNDEYDSLVSLSEEFSIIGPDDPLPPGAIEAFSKAVIVTVPGLSFVNTSADLVGLPNIDERVQYLKDGLLDLDLQNRVNPGDIYPYAWDGDAGDTDLRIPELKTLIREKYQEAVDEDKLFIVISHSWGTVLSYHSLLDLTGPAGEVDVDLYITLSSPMGSVYYFDEDLFSLETIIVEYLESWWDEDYLDYSFSSGSYPQVSAFENVWCWGDFISGELPTAIPNLKNFACDSDNPNFGDDDYRSRDQVAYYHGWTSMDPDLDDSFEGFQPVDVRDRVRKHIIDAFYE